MNSGLRKLIFGLGLAIFSIVLGVGGYMVIEGYSITQAVYMTAITISTVGFREAKPLSEGGMIFTSAYILMNLGLFAYIVSYVARFIFDGELQSEYRNYSNNKVLKKMKDHVIVCGYGRNGSKAVSELRNSKVKCVVIENDTKITDELKHSVDAIVHADASDEQSLLRAGIENAEALIITLPNDADNVYITLSAREISSTIKIISRASQEKTKKKLLKAGADTVVMPDSLGGKHMAQLITKPSVIQFLNILEGIEGVFNVEQVKYEDVKSEYHGSSILEMNIRKTSGVSVMAYQSSEGSFQINPSATTVLQPGGNFIIMGGKEELDEFGSRFLNSKIIA